MIPKKRNRLSGKIMLGDAALVPEARLSPGKGPESLERNPARSINSCGCEQREKLAQAGFLRILSLGNP